MKRSFIAVLSIFTVGSIVSWKLASHQEVSVGLQDVSVIQSSELTHLDPENKLERFRFRISPTNFDLESTTPANAVPQIALAAE